MCSICKKWQLGQIDSRQAFVEIGEALKVANAKQKSHLMVLSEEIINKDVPLVERDEYADNIWNESYRDKK